MTNEEIAKNLTNDELLERITDAERIKNNCQKHYDSLISIFKKELESRCIQISVVEEWAAIYCNEGAEISFKDLHKFLHQ